MWFQCTLFLLWIQLNFHSVLAQKPLGGVFDEGSLLLEAAFRVAVASASENLEEETKLQARSLQLAPNDITDAGRKTCELLQGGVGGIVGPSSKESIQYVHSICDALEVPQVLTQLMEAQERSWSVINMYPYYRSLSKVFADLILAKGWESFTVVYEGSEHLSLLDEVLTLTHFELDIVMHMIQLPDGDDFKPYLTAIKRSGSVNYLVDCSAAKLQTLLEQAQQVGIMSDQHSYLVLTPDMQTLDLEPFQYGGANITGIRLFDPESESVINFATLLEAEVTELSEGNYEGSITPGTLPLSAVLVYDAVLLYASSMSKLDSAFTPTAANCEVGTSMEHGWTIVNLMRTTQMDGLTGFIQFDNDGFRSNFYADIMELTTSGFGRVGTWDLVNGYIESRPPVVAKETEGSVLMKGKHFIILTALSAPYGMRRESAKKLEGNEQYEGFGIELIQELAKIHQFNYTFELQIDGAYGSLDKKTGKWNGMMEKIMDGRADFAITDLTITADRQKAVDFTSPFMNLGISILYKKPTKQPPDLFSFISPFSLEVWGWLAGEFVSVSVLLFLLGRICPDEWQNPYPCIEEPETLVNKVISRQLLLDHPGQRAHRVWGWLAGEFVSVSVLLFLLGRICPDEWQNPYPCIEEPETLVNKVWGWLAGAFVGVSVLLFVVGRICPDEWQNPYPCIEEPETLVNQFSLANSFWFTLGSVLTQGSEIAPIAVSTRMAGSMWWFFTMIMVASYTANLAAFLTVEAKFSPIDNAQDLANNQYDIKYGAKKGGSTLSFFKESDNAVYQKMYEYMNSHPEYLTASNDEGLERVQSTEYEYAYLMESTSIEYIVERNCDVAQIGGLIDNKGYGIAMKQGSPYRQPMSEAVLQLQEQGKITRMKDKWWKEKRGGGACADDDGGGGQALALELSNVGGVFIVLASGCGLAVFCALFEMVLDVWAISIREKVPFLEELLAEFKFIATFSGLTKPVRHQDSSHSGSGGTNKEQDGDKEMGLEESGCASPAPSGSERSLHSRHTAHSQRSHSVKMARMRKYSHFSER